MTNTREEKRAYWAEVVKKWKESGETRSKYCRRHHLKPHQLIYRIQVEESKNRTKPMPTTKGFVALQVTETHTPGITLRMPNGLQIEGVHAGNLAVIREIIGWQA